MIQSIQQNVTWRAIPFAAIFAGTVFLLTNLLLLPPVLEVEGDVILLYFASLLLGSDILTEANTSYLVLGILVHYLLSFVFTLVIAIVVHRWGLLVGIVGGAIMGLSIYGINLYAMTLIFDWFFAMNTPILLLSHVLFGAVAGGIYEVFDHYDLPVAEGVTRETA